MREKFINDTCVLFAKALPDIDLATVRNILALSLEPYEITKPERELIKYEGDPNENILKAFIVSKKVNGASNNTLKYYGFILRQFFRKADKRADEITTNDVRVYFAKRELEDNVSSTTRNNERRILCSFFGWAQDEELINKNPMRKVSKIKGRKEQKKAFSAMELEQIRSHCKNEKESAIIEILISTGCRVSELCGITTDEIDGDAVTVHGKGNKDRTCYLTAKARLAIDEYMSTEFYQKRFKLGSPYLFPRENIAGGEYMQPMGKTTVEHITKRIGKETGVNKCHPHRFRRTCATMALDRGMPIEQVSKMLGHESIATTQVYLDLTEESLKNAHRKYVV